MDLVQQLAAIRNAAGLDPLPDHTIIHGFEDGSPPPPDQSRAEAGLVDEPEDYPDTPPQTHQSPLVAAGLPQPPPVIRRVGPPPEGLGEAPRGLPVLPVADLLILDGAAAYKGRTVELTGEEQAKVVTLVLEAMQRDIEDQLAQVRQPGLGNPTLKDVTVVAEPPKRKPGRPRKGTA